jgi:4-hydroxybenzoate polyprenyltransferase/phosphoserine phosphatase
VQGGDFHKIAGDSAVGQPLPLCVDFDGTLVKTDSLHECLLVALKMRPFALIRILPLAFTSRAKFKARLWSLTANHLQIATLPRQPKVVELVQKHRASGSRVELVSAANAEMLRSDPALVEMFDDILGSGASNLKGPAKAAALRARHPGGFAYVGDSLADVPVFKAAAQGYGVGLSKATERALAADGIRVEPLASKESSIVALFKAMRLHQWFKNILMLVPAGLGLRYLDGPELLRFVAGFILLGLLASATYLINDLFDLASDRRHPRKSARALASGALPLAWAIIAAPLAILAALVFGYLLEPLFGGMLLLYLGLTLAYSIRLKQTPIMDVFVIGLLFTLRVVAGMTLIAQPPSQWLLIFSVFFFTGLAFMKRDAEIAVLAAANQHALKGRGYTVQDRAFVQISGLSTSIASLVIFALFIAGTFEDARQYSSPYFLWASYFLLAYWMLRLWFMTFRGQMHDDPIVYAIKDRKSLAIFVAIGVIVILAQIV